MLSPANPTTPWILGVVFVLLIAGLALNAMLKDRREYRRFTRLRSTALRQKMLRRWLLQSLAIFGGSSLVVLALAWQFAPLVLAGINAWPWVADARRTFINGGALAVGITLGVTVAVVAVAVLGIVAARGETEVPALGNVQALLPRNRAELPYGAALSLNAGLVEELLFRLALPALLFGITQSSVAAVAVSLVVFGLLHVYQGVWGILGSMFLGALLMAIYVATGSILAAIIAHALINLRSLVLIPMVVFRVHKVAP